MRGGIFDVTVLYPRLSHEDELSRESNSISNQTPFIRDKFTHKYKKPY